MSGRVRVQPVFDAEEWATVTQKAKRLGVTQVEFARAVLERRHVDRPADRRIVRDLARIRLLLQQWTRKSETGRNEIAALDRKLVQAINGTYREDT